MPEQDPSIYRQYEEAATRKGGYERLGNDPDPKWHKWGNVLIHRVDGSVSRESFYTSPEITHRLFTEPVNQFLAEHEVPKDVDLTIVDFGGASGGVLRQVADELQADGYDRLKPVVVDKNVEALKEARDRGLGAVAAGMADPPFSNGTVDVALSRFSLQYLGDSPTGNEVVDYNLRDKAGESIYAVSRIEQFFVRDNQEDFFRNLYYAMRSDGIGVLVFPAGSSLHEQASRKDAAGLWKRLFSKLMGENLMKYGSLRHFPSVEDTAKMAQKAGFTVRVAEEIDWLEFRFTPEAIFDRFDMSPEAQQVVRDTYDQYLADPKMSGDVDLLTKAIRFPIARLIITTEGRGHVDVEMKEKQREELYFRNFQHHSDWDRYDVSEPSVPHLDRDFNKGLPDVPGWNPYEPPTGIKEDEK